MHKFKHLMFIKKFDLEYYLYQLTIVTIAEYDKLE